MVRVVRRGGGFRLGREPGAGCRGRPGLARLPPGRDGVLPPPASSCGHGRRARPRPARLLGPLFPRSILTRLS